MNNRWLVMKFGGTSVASATNWREIAKQARLRSDVGYHVMIVVSAIRGVTDELAEQSQQKLAPTRILSRYDALRGELGLVRSKLEAAVEAEFEGLAAGVSGVMEPPATARWMAMGERLSSALGKNILDHLLDEPVTHTAATSLLTSTPEASPNPAGEYLAAVCEPIPDRAKANRLASAGRIHITEGFTASHTSGAPVLLGRGGSDTSAAYLAVTLGAEEIEIWSDVPGLFTANPHQLPGARLLKQLSYREAQELASMGARVLHPRCIAPLRDHEISIRLRQTARPDIAGTHIAARHPETAAQVKAIAQRQDVTLIVMEGLTMWQQVGFLADAFAVFKRHGLSIDLISTSEANITVSLDVAEHSERDAELSGAVAELGALCHVRLIENCASVSMVGLGIRTILHRLGPAFEVFEQRRIHLVTQAANDLNLTVVVDQEHADRLVMQLHQNLIPGGVGGDSVFGPTWEQLYRREEPTARETPWWRSQIPAMVAALSDRDAAYVYSSSRCAENARRLQQIRSVDRVFYAMKANGHPNLLKAVAECGLGIECVSPGELERVRQCLPDLAPDRILYTPNFAALADYQAGLDCGCFLTVDNLFVLENWGEHFQGREILLRIDPGSGLGHHKLVRTAGVHSKFGIPESDLDRAADYLSRWSIKVIGLHAHTGSGVMHPDAWQRTLEHLGEVTKRFPDVRYLDLGGGLGVPDKSNDSPFDLAALDEAIARGRASLHRDLEIWLEPGRYLVSDAGVLLARVTQTKGKADVRYVGIATGMNSLIRPALYGAYHEIHNLTRIDEPGTAIHSVVGPICETGDIIGLDRLLPECQTNDVLLIDNAGAYGAVMASQYNLRSPASELCLD